ncbi:hypothetical protein L5515_012044 [Caenorhabditis briggsae]|uniref:Uncharacterized protein n=1 Tax=Caenorhabditis briggsae TaxID=6238 RepID=A0AAE9EW48_CAEBR|nr:hypothetical protein L5515_012044 [Caenorhabditis briggsae]
MLFAPTLRTKSSRSLQSRSRPLPVNVPASRLSLPSETTTVTLDSESSAPRKSPPPSVELLLPPSSPLFQSAEDTGVTRSDFHTPFHAKLPESAPPLWSDSSQPHVVPESFLPQSQRSFLPWLESRIATPPLRDPPLPLGTSPRPPMPLSKEPTPTSPQISGRRRPSRSRHTNATTSSLLATKVWNVFFHLLK